MGLTFTEQASPGTPSANKVMLYAKADGRLYFKSDSGVEVSVRAVGAGTGDLLSDGTVPLTANWDVGPYNLIALQFESDVTTGTAPLIIASTTLVANLNAALLGGTSLAGIQALIDAAVVGLYDHKGGYNASTNTPDLDTAPSGIKKSDAYTVSVAGTFYAVTLEAGDVLIADQDDPTASTHWTIVNRNIDSSAFLPNPTKLDDLATPDDNTDLNAGTSAHGLLIKATAPAAGLLNVVGIGNAETAYSIKAIFDTTNPAAVGVAGPGTELIAARRDHIHPFPNWIFTSDVPTVANQDYVLWYDAPFAGTITLVRTETTGGTCTVTGKIITTALGGTANSASSTAQEQAHSSANTFAKGDKILFTVTSNSAALNLAVAFYGTRTS